MLSLIQAAESEGEHRSSLQSPSYPSSCLQEIAASQYRFCTRISHAWQVCNLGRRKATGGSLSHQGVQLKCQQVWAIPRQALERRPVLINHIIRWPCRQSSSSALGQPQVHCQQQRLWWWKQVSRRYPLAVSLSAIWRWKEETDVPSS